MGSVPPDKRNRTPICLKVMCPKHEHDARGWQKARDLFELTCLICGETAAEKFDEPRQREYSQDRIRTPCGKHKSNSSVMDPLIELGHAFCRSCIETAIEYGCNHEECLTPNCRRFKCPTCRKELPNGIVGLRSFK